MKGFVALGMLLILSPVIVAMVVLMFAWRLSAEMVNSIGEWLNS